MEIKNTVESIVCDAIIQTPKEIKIRDKVYKIAHPVAATIIEVSKYISQLPGVRINENGNIISESLSFAHECNYIGDIIAILMLGKNNLVTKKQIPGKKLLGFIQRSKSVTINNQKILAEELMSTYTWRELHELMLEILQMQDVNFFFGILTFLKEINILQQTKTTASGQPSDQL